VIKSTLKNYPEINDVIVTDFLHLCIFKSWIDSLSNKAQY